MNLGLAEKIVLLTASRTGIGAETAALLASEGATVVTSSRSVHGPSIGEARHISVDLLDAGGPEGLVEDLAAEFGRIDCLVNNFGHAEICDFNETTGEQWGHAYVANFLSPLRTIRAVLPFMCRQADGSIVNVGSTAGRRPSVRMPQYSVTKAALHALSRSVAEEYADRGIRSNVVIPGPTVTPSWLRDGGLAEQQGEREAVLQKAAAARPLGRFARPDEIAPVIAYLCSARSAHISGVEWSVSGGSVP